RRERKADRVVLELLPLETSEAGFGAVRAALVNEDDLAGGVESVLDHERPLERPGPPGPARQVPHRIGPGRRRGRGGAATADAARMTKMRIRRPSGLARSSSTVR